MACGLLPKRVADRPIAATANTVAAVPVVPVTTGIGTVPLLAANGVAISTSAVTAWTVPVEVQREACTQPLVAAADDLPRVVEVQRVLGGLRVVV